MEKGGDSLPSLPYVLVYQSEVIPSVRILRQLPCRFFERRAPRLQLLLSEERNTKVQPGHCKFGVGFQGLVEIFLCVCRPLLVHIGDAKRIQTISVGNPAAR